jgi:hypothetical protein
MSELRRIIKPGGYMVSYVHSHDDGYLQTVAANANCYQVDGTGIVDYAYSEPELRAFYKKWQIIDMHHIEKKDVLCGKKYIRRLWYILCRNEK